jgi:hypothetical protein
MGKNTRKKKTPSSGHRPGTTHHSHDTRQSSKIREPPDKTHNDPSTDHTIATSNPFASLPCDDDSVHSSYSCNLFRDDPLPSSDPLPEKPNSALTSSSQSLHGKIAPDIIAQERRMTSQFDTTVASIDQCPPHSNHTNRDDQLLLRFQELIQASEHRIESKITARFESLSPPLNHEVKNNVNPTSSIQPTLSRTLSDHTHSKVASVPSHDSLKPSFKSEPHQVTKSVPLFGQNDFTLACKGKIKYLEMEKYLANRKLVDDSQYELEKLYAYLTRSIGFVFEFEITTFPSFRDLDSTINFHNCFLTGISDGEFRKCSSVFHRIGEIIKDKFGSLDFISPQRSPKAYNVISSNPLDDGWTMLERLLKARHVLCGAVPDFDLDDVRASLHLQPSESFHDFYRRTQRLVNDYMLQYRDEDNIPITKITQRFLNELSRAPEYIPYLTAFQTQLLDHIQAYGSTTSVPALPVSIQSIYTYLIRVRAPSAPSTLRMLTPSHQSTGSSTSPPQAVSAPLIASFTDHSTNHGDAYDPTINALTKKEKCPACLMGYHEPDDCYHRGPNFRDPAFNRRIKVYNQQFGDKPKPGHKIREWKPYSPSPIHSRKNLPPRTQTNQSSVGESTRPCRQPPFANADTKSKLHTPATINAFTTTFDHSDPSVPANDPLLSLEDLMSQLEPPSDNPNNDDSQSTVPPSMSSLHHQTLPCPSSDTNTMSYPEICSASLHKPVRLRHNPSPLPHSFHPNTSSSTKVRDSTPPVIQQSLLSSHSTSTADKANLTKHSSLIRQLDPTSTSKHCSLVFQIDGGANCGAVTTDTCFYFYIPSEMNVQQVDGSSFRTPGWGGILVRIDGHVRMLAPFYLCPNNPRNTFSPSCLTEYCGFKQTTIHTNRYISMVDQSGISLSQDISVYNDLDFIDLEIMRLDHPDVQASIFSTSLHKKVRFHLPNIMSASSTTITSTSDTQKIPSPVMPVFPRHVMNIIASYYVQLFQPSSPQETAIRTMNSLLNNRFRNLSSPSPHRQPSSVLPGYTSKSNDRIIVPVIAKLSRTTQKRYTPIQQYMQLHVSFMHASNSTLGPILRRQLLRDLPKRLHTHLDSLSCTCSICALRKGDKLPRGKLTDHTKLPPFRLLHIDFSFFGTTSIRGFTSALDVTCGSTSYPIGFPTKSKSPPLEIVRWVISTLRSMGFEVTFIRVDEGGELARSAEFCSLIVSLSCLLQTTAGGNSSNNGRVERSNRTKANMIRSQLTTMKMIMKKKVSSDFNFERYWCFAYQHGNFILRRTYNRMRDEIPYFLVHGSRPSVLEMVPMGSIMTIIAQDKQLHPKLGRDRAKTGYFLCFGNHIKSHCYLDPDYPDTFKRSHHSIIEDNATLPLLIPGFASPNAPAPSSSSSSNIKDCIITSTTFDTIDSPFPREDIFTIKLEIAASMGPLGMQIRDDLNFNLPFLQKSVIGSFAYNALPPKHRHNQFIIGINGHAPITAKYALSLIKEIRSSSSPILTFDFVRRGQADNSTPLQLTRAMFDQLPSFIHSRPVINSFHVPESHNHFVTSPTKPAVPKQFHECLRSPLRHNWISAAWNQFEKNKSLVVFSAPFPRSDISKEARVFRSQLIPEVKCTNIPTVFELKVRDVVVGTPQVQYLDYQEHYAPTIDPTTIKLQIAFSCHRNYQLGIIDVSNAFQNTIAPESSRIYVSVPPTYLNWLKSTEDFSFDPNEKYVRQMMNSNQGTKDAGNLWYQLVLKVFTEYGLQRCTVDQCLFVRSFDDKTFLYVSVATDDFLCSFATMQHFLDFKLFLDQFFKLTVNCGPVLKFLGLRIIQSNSMISIDQSEYIFELLKSYFGTDVERIKTAKTPMRYDSNFEKDLYNATPLTDVELKDISLKYRGSYRYHTGCIQYIACQTRYDIGFCANRLAEYNTKPNIVAFESIAHLYRYLAGDPLRPLVYPKRCFDTYDTVSYFVTPDRELTLQVNNAPTIFTDAELARDIATRRSYFCSMIMVFNVIVQMKIQKTSTVMHHTTDAEMKGAFFGVRQVMPIRQMFAFMGYPLGQPSTLFIDNAAVAAVIAADRMTPRCRHFDIPVALLQCEKHKTFIANLVGTKLMVADMGTKPNDPPTHRRFKLWASGAKYLPAEGTVHFDLLQMKYYEMNYVDILRDYLHG